MSNESEDESSNDDDAAENHEAEDGVMTWLVLPVVWTDFLVFIVVPITVIAVSIAYFYHAKQHPSIYTVQDGFLPFFGHSIEYYRQAVAKHREHDWISTDILRQHASHRLVCLSFAFNTNLILINNDVRLVKHLFTKHGKQLFVSRHRFECFRDLLGTSIFTRNGDPHRVMVTKLLPFFTRNGKPNGLFERVFHAQSLSMIRTVTASHHGEYFNLNEVLFRSLLSALCVLSIGTDLNLMQSYPKSTRFLNAFNATVYFVNARFYKSSYWKILHYFKCGTENVVQDGIAFMESVLVTICESRKLRLQKVHKLNEKIAKQNEANKLSAQARKTQQKYLKKKNVSEDSNDGNELQQQAAINTIEASAGNLVDFCLSHDEEMDLQQLRDNLFTFLYTSRDFIALLVAWCFYELTLEENRHVYEAVLDEIQAMDGGHFDSSKLQFLENCLFETLRLHPVKPWIIRQCMTNIEVPSSKQTLNRDDLIAIHCYSFGRSDTIWTQPLTFKPQRFEGKNKADAYKNMLFGIADHRICMGQSMGLDAAKRYIFNVLKDYDVIPKPGQDITYAASSVLHFRQGFQCKFTRREKS